MYMYVKPIEMMCRAHMLPSVLYIGMEVTKASKGLRYMQYLYKYLYIKVNENKVIWVVVKQNRSPNTPRLLALYSL